MALNNEIRKRKRSSDPLSDVRTLQALANKASSRALKKSKDSGISVVYVENGFLVKRNPDGTVINLKTLEPKARLGKEDLICQA